MKIRERKAKDEKEIRATSISYYSRDTRCIKWRGKYFPWRYVFERNTQPLHIAAPVDDRHALVECDQDIGQRLAIRIVEVHGEFGRRNAGGEDRVEHQRGGHCGVLRRKSGKMRDTEVIKHKGSDSVVKEVYYAKKKLRKSDRVKKANT
jgi:hypothetical protein